MPFQKGHKRYGGKEPGTKNKKTIEELDRAARVLQLIESKYLEDDIKALSSNQRMLLYADMMEYKAPKLSRTTIVGDKDNPLEAAITYVLDERYKNNAGIPT